jgi:septal ring factor EnvC (AmiA/AmiB activator)
MRVALAVLAVMLLAAPAVGQDRMHLRGGQAARDYRAQAREVAREVEALRKDLVRLGRSQAVDERSAARQRRKLNQLRKQEAALTASLGRNRSQLGKLLGSLQLYQRDPPPPLFVHARSARDAARAAVLMKSVTPQLAERGRVLSARAEAIRKVRREATAASETLLLTESELEERRSEVERLIGEKNRLERKLLANADAAEARARALAERAGSLGELVEGLAALEQAPHRGGALTLVQPVQGDLVRRFGDRSGKVLTRGVTFRTQASAQVLAPADAKVEYVGPLKGYGLIVILRPEEAYHVVLAGLDQAASGAGRWVAAGEPIGRMAGGGAELYLEVRRQGAPVDPARWLAAPLRRTGRSTG